MLGGVKFGVLLELQVVLRVKVLFIAIRVYS